MKKVFFILFLLFSISTIYAERISIENYVVKEISNNSKQETFYLGQTKSKAVFDSFKTIYESEKIDNYDGFNNVIKLFNKDIELYFTEGDIYKLVEIRIKTNKYFLYGTSISVGTNINEAIDNYRESFTSMKEHSQYYFAEIEDIFFEFPGVSFFNISLEVKDDIIQNIILYYSFAI